MSDIIKPGPLAGGAKSNGFLDKIAKFTIGNSRGGLPSNEAGAAEQAPPAVPHTKWQKLKLHYGRFWICYLILLIVGLAILLPILFIFIIPAIAQDLLNSGSIVIDAASILQPTSTSVMLKISSHVYVPGPFTVKTDPLQLQIFVPQTGSDYPMATLNMPANSIHKNTSMNMDGSQFTPFENYTSWQGFVHNTIFLDDGGLGLKGHVGTQLGQIKKFNLDINKVAPSKALNQFKGFSIDSARLLLPAESDGTNLLANATLPNQSVLTLEIGNTTVDILSGNLTIATGLIENLYLTPGNNSFSIRAKANLTNLIANIGEVLTYQGPYIRDGNLSLTTRVTNIKYNGSTVPYYTEEMGKLHLTAQTPLIGLLLNTITGLLHGSVLNSTVVQEIKDKLHGDHGNLQSQLGDLVDNSTELESLTRRHLEDLVMLLGQ